MSDNYQQFTPYNKTLTPKNGFVSSSMQGSMGVMKPISTPKNIANQKRLFNSVPDLSAQGNSHGQVNDPKVFSEGTFICGACDQSFLTNDEVTNHKSEAHDNANFQCGECSKCFISIEEVQKHNDKDHTGSQQELNEEDEVLEDELVERGEEIARGIVQDAQTFGRRRVEKAVERPD